MNREVHVRFCERFRGEIPLYLLDVFCRKYDFNRKFFKFLLAKSNFHASAFRSVIFDVFLLFRFFSFCFSDSNFHASVFKVSIFQVSVGDSNFNASAL